MVSQVTAIMTAPEWLATRVVAVVAIFFLFCVIVSRMQRRDH